MQYYYDRNLDKIIFLVRELFNYEKNILYVPDHKCALNSNRFK